MFDTVAVDPEDSEVTHCCVLCCGWDVQIIGERVCKKQQRVLKIGPRESENFCTVSQIVAKMPPQRQSV